MATAKLLGTDTAGTTNLGTGYIHASQFTCATSGRVTEIRVRCLVNSNVKAAIYSDNGSNQVGSLLAESASIAVTAGDWRTVTLNSGADVVAGTKYWPCVKIETAGGCAYRTVSVNRGYKAAAYGDSFPSDGSGFSYDTAVENSLQGFGILVVSPTSTTQPISYGEPTVEVAPGLFIVPTSIVQVISIGTPSLLYPQTITPSSIVQAIVIGTPAIVGGVPAGLIIIPTSIVQQISIGSPTLYKYVWHVILDGRYITTTPPTNRAYVIGRDDYGNPVYGTAVDSTELGLVGERLDFQQELAIPTTAQAESVAGAILAKMRLTGKRGVILVPPNCGQELFDVVQISDAGANQSAVAFRVVGIRFEYNPRQAKYEHRLILGAP